MSNPKVGGIDWTQTLADPLQTNTATLGLASWLRSRFGDDTSMLAQFERWLQAQQQSGQLPSLVEQLQSRAATGVEPVAQTNTGGSVAGGSKTVPPPPFGVDALI